MLRIYETDCAALAPYWDEALALLPPERRQRVQLCRDRAAVLGIAAGGLLLRAVLGVRTDGRLLKGPCGKPHIPGGPEFNLSHGGTLAVLAVSDRAVGVDCEDARRGASKALLRRVLTPEEWEDSPAAIPFSRLWTRKEAVMKACGLGLGLAPASYCVLDDLVQAEGQTWRLHTLELRGHFVSCAAEAAEAPELLHLPPEALLTP